jgi:hypothetical protein
MRVLLATEGPSDECVGESLIHVARATATIIKKRYPARGIASVLRSVPDLVRAANYQLYDLLVIHADLDDTVSPGINIQESSRWQDISKMAFSTLEKLPWPPARQEVVKIAIMAPVQATDTWVAWGCDGGDGISYERQHRHDLKHKLYGNPPRGMVDKAKSMVVHLPPQMRNNGAWPPSLRAFMDQIT